MKMSGKAQSNCTDSIEHHSLPSIPNNTVQELRNEIITRDEKEKEAQQAPIVKSPNFLKPVRANKTKISISEPLNGRTKSYAVLRVSEDIVSASSIKPLDSNEVIHLPKLRPSEEKFLQLVSKDNVNAVREYLQTHANLNINCANFQGITALHIALQNQSESMVEFLLERNIEIGDTVLRAVLNNNIRIMEKLLDARKKISPGLEFAGVTHSADFPEHLTPLILAAQLGHYEIVALLISRGHTISRPHLPNCRCKKCKYMILDTVIENQTNYIRYLSKQVCIERENMKIFIALEAERTVYLEGRNSIINEDALYTTSARLAVYQAISSPAYLVHVSSDPVLVAFQLTEELVANAAVHLHLATAYMKLSEDVSMFAVELIGCCRTSEEVELILKQTSGSAGRRQFVLPRLLMAVDSKQKGFVAHPNTQQVLESYWVRDWHSWRKMLLITKVFIITSRMFVTPFILLMCMIAPRHHLVKHWQIPLNKLITHAAAYFVFLALVFHISNRDKSNQKRGPPDTGAEFPLVLYVFGYTWSAIRMCLMHGPRRYFGEMWNWAEIIMLVLFHITFALWSFATFEDPDLVKHQERKYWSQYDPTLLAEGTFCLATIFAYFRLMLFCQLNYHLGPLQVSLGKMTIDIYRYIIVFAIIISAFAAGLARLYQYYDGMVYEDEYGMKTVQVSSFTSLSDTLNTLFWALFCMAPLESADVVLENTRDVNSVDKYRENRHGYTERIGYFCFGCFEVISVIVVLNMLIATMSNTFQRVNDNVAIEWTFGRTQVYVDYMSQTTLPSPYNMIPTAAGMSGAFDWIRAKMFKTKGVHAWCSPSFCCYIERDLEANVQMEFSALMTVLVQRYFSGKKSGLLNSKSIEEELDSIHREILNVKKMLDTKKERNGGEKTKIN